MNRDQVLGCSFAVLVASVLLYVVARNFVKSRKKSTCRKADDTGASSSSAASAGSDSYDVFLSFSGNDTRKTFTDHLYNGLVGAGIRVFRDDNELREGEEIGVNLLQAIKNSKISIPILSLNYPSSKWCLRELVEMKECKKSVGQVVLPIFYRVEPNDVQHQKGSFGKMFSKLSKKNSKEDIAKWKQALQEMTSLKGWVSEKTANGHEGELVKMVVSKVLIELKNAFQLVVPEQLVGIENAVENVSRLLDDNPNGTKIVGIYGMGGIGKTTLAKFIYNKLLGQFQYRSFIEDIRESSRQPNGIRYLQNQLISDLKAGGQVSNTDEGIRILESRFQNKKVLILLDDVDDSDQIKALVEKLDWFAKGSKIIITTRIRSVLDEAGVNYQYNLEELADDKSLILFSRHAFRRDSPPCEFESLSCDVVSTARGLPLALKVIGSFLCGRNREFWQGALEKLQKVPHEKVQEKLMISYNALNDEEKQIFLDIACFFIGEDLRYASYMWDACGYHPKMEIEILSFMSLIKIGKDGKVRMHDQLRDLGREIVQQEDHKVPMNRSRLWEEGEAMKVLERNKGIQKDHIEALCLDEHWKNKENITLVGDSEREFTTEQFETLPNLRFLIVHAKLIGDSRNLLPELRWLTWKGCPAFRATNFCLEKLVILDLSRSDISEHWEGWRHLKMAKQLKVLDLSDCNCLEITPNLSAIPNLEIFQLKVCRNLKRIHPSIGAAKGLVFLDLQGCHELQELPQEMGKLEKLKELYISKTAIWEIPPCIGSLKELEVLSATECKSLVGLPDSISHLVNLLTLDLNCCPKLCKLPESIGSLVKLERLSCNIDWHAKESSDSSICTLPESIGDLKNLKFLDIGSRKKLSNLPSTISKLGNLEELDAANCRNLKGEIHIDGLASLKILKLDLTDVFGFHGTFDKLSRLEKLDVHRCWKLQSLSELPASLTFLKVSGQHRTFPRLSHLIHLKELNVMDCPLLESMPELPSGLLTLSVLCCGGLREFSSLSSLEFLLGLFLRECGELIEVKGLEGLKSLATLEVGGCGKLSNLDGLEHLESLRSLAIVSNGLILNDDQVQGLEKLKNLETLIVKDCESLVRPDFSQLTHLLWLVVEDCKSLVRLDFSQLSHLQRLVVQECKSLVRMDVSQLTHLWWIDFGGCQNLVEIEGIERLKNLTHLNLVGCPSVRTLPDLSCFHNLRSVWVDERSNLVDVPGVDKVRYHSRYCREFL